MTVRTVSNIQGQVITLAAQALTGATSVGGEVGLEQNTAAKIAADLYDLIGQPGAGLTAGKQGQLIEKRDAYNAAVTARRAAIQAGRDFNAKAVDHLKTYLGRRWNLRWQAAGFTTGTLTMPYDPLPLLVQLRSYFFTHAAHENPANNLTAAKADTLAAAIPQALHDENSARSARKTAVEERDGAFATLRGRMVGLRSELDQLLDDDDVRWFKFGFSRPVDGRIPARVEVVTLRPTGQQGEIIVEWTASVGAENYRVTRQIVGVDTEAVEVGIIAELMTLIAGLPSGKTVKVNVSARNAAGESLPTQAGILIA